MTSMIQVQASQTQREDKERKKEEMLRRVREIQEKVMPLIEDRNENGYKNEEDIGWRTKMEQKVTKLETAVDALQKALEIKLEKQVL